MCLVKRGTEEKELSALDVLRVANSSLEPLTEVVPGKGICTSSGFYGRVHRPVLPTGA